MSVYGTVAHDLKLRGFSWQQGINRFAGNTPLVIGSQRLDGRVDLPAQPAYTLEPGRPSPGRPSLLRPLIAVIRGTGILTCFPSATPFGLTLGSD